MKAILNDVSHEDYSLCKIFPYIFHHCNITDWRDIKCFMVPTFKLPAASQKIATARSSARVGISMSREWSTGEMSVELSFIGPDLDFSQVREKEQTRSNAEAGHTCSGQNKQFL